MAYHGMIKLFQKVLYMIEKPCLLEVGVDTGATLVPLVQFLSLAKTHFNVDAVDIMPNVALEVMLSNMVLSPTQCVNYVIKNSIDFLTEMQSSPDKVEYNIALVDGDHNYFTVKRELELLSKLMAPQASIVCDDYNGKWAEKDLFYSERAGYEEVSIATPVTDTEKKGVKAAVDDFVRENPEWKLTPTLTEPAVLAREIVWTRT